MTFERRPITVGSPSSALRGGSAAPTIGLTVDPNTLGTPPSPIGGDEVRGLFLLDPAITFLNHGSFGAVPAKVMDAQERWRRTIESRPIEMLGRRVRSLIAPSKEAVGRLLGCAPAEIGFVTNATEAINGVLGSLSFQPGDELLTTNHVYNAVRQAMRFTAARWHATYREIEIPLPCASAHSVAARVLDAISPSTRLLVIDHVTSPTALVFPVEPIVAACRARGVHVIVDGAHAPGMLPLDLTALDADAYAANLHKWLFVPKGCGILRTSAAWRSRVHPVVVSHFYGEGFEQEFDWQGTRDVSAWIVAADALAFVEQIGVERLRDHNHRLVTWAHAMLCNRLGVEPLSPSDGSMLGSMATIRLPAVVRSRFDRVESLAAHLYEQERIELPVIDFGGHWHVRISAQIYNRAEEYERLADALRRVLDGQGASRAP